MATIYELSYQRTLHKEKKALSGVIYRTEDKYFKGTADGYLDDITSVTISNSINTDITNINADLTAVDAELLRLESVKADKCFAIAMSIVLG